MYSQRKASREEEKNNRTTRQPKTVRYITKSLLIKNFSSGKQVKFFNQKTQSDCMD